MKAKGIKGNYFRLGAILLTVMAVKLSALLCRVRQKTGCPLLRFLLSSEENDPPPQGSAISCLVSFITSDGISFALFLPSSKATHCNCVFKRRSFLALNYQKIQKLRPCRCRHRKTGLAPPLF